jgi:hypothetical protein
MTTIKSVGKIGLHLASKLISRLEKAGLTVRLAKEISSSPNNYLAEKMMAPVRANITNIAIRQNSAEIKKIKNDKRFQKIAEFKVLISAASSIDRFIEKHRQELNHFNKNLKDANFCPSDPLEVGQEKTALIYRLKRNPSNKDCLGFIKAHNGQLPNAQGLTESYEQGSKHFPEGLFVIGFDEEKNLWCDRYAQPTLPILGRLAGGKIHFNLTSLKGEKGENDCIIFFVSPPRHPNQSFNSHIQQ